MNEKMNKLMILEMGSCQHRGPGGECGGGGGLVYWGLRNGASLSMEAL